jgi:hypothetical protein
LGNAIYWNTGDSTYNPFRTLGNTANVTWQQYNNTWTHFAVVNNSSTLSASLYINGKLTGSAAYRNPTTNAGVGDLTVGGYVYSSATNYNFKGEIDDFRIYTGSLSSKQVESIYLSPDSGTGRTIISGDSISTGHLRSNNWGPSFGSEFNLNSGTFKLGGSTAPKLSWNGTTLAVTGEVSASSGRIGGFGITADAITGSQFFLSGSATGNQFFISSSKFNVKASGDITASSALFSGSVSITGDVNAKTGTIGGFRITADAITGSQFFLSGSATGNQFFISSKFNIKASGDITASSALFSGSVSITGDVNAKTGTIGGFRITADAITGSQFFLSGSATGNQFFISSSKFNVKASGDITASSALFSGSVSITGDVNAKTGTIGGFRITADAITGSQFFLSGSATGNQFFISSSKFNVKASGDITASSALFTGSLHVGNSTSNYLKFNATNGLQISGDITVSNPDSFYMPNKTRSSYKLAYIDSGSACMQILMQKDIQWANSYLHH